MTEQKENYQVIARRYRPKGFKEVLGQNAIVTTLKNAIHLGRIAHAYLFCGSRGTGKTTLARIFAKAINCPNLSEEFEPCNTCPSCKEIASGSSMDVMEIDGASNRGIDDIRKINETVGYAAASSKYKIYIIDEVHMLTKEAFNALLKTLEEPPPMVKFFFATTEAHKVLPTILSRCQRFNLNRIPLDSIIAKLRFIAEDMKLKVSDEAFQMIAKAADGGMRDAESIFDQITSFHEGDIDNTIVAELLGMMPKESLFALDRAGKEANYAYAFELAGELFSQGKNIAHFVDTLIEHFRTLLRVKLAGTSDINPNDVEAYQASAKLYNQETCLNNLDYLVAAQNELRYQPSRQVALEVILLHIMRSHARIPVEVIIRRLEAMQNGAPPPKEPPPPAPKKEVKKEIKKDSILDNPTPSPKDLGIKVQKKAPPPPKPKAAPKPPLPVVEGGKAPSEIDTLLQFAKVELEGTVKKHR